jgi:hypothetical protein
LHRAQVRLTPPVEEIFRQRTRPSQQRAKCSKNPAVEVGEAFERFFGEVSQ